MDAIQLSHRLQAVAEQVPSGLVVADIGSDHAFLPCALVLSKRAPYAIAGEVNEGPYQSAKQQVASLGLADYISVRKGDGLSIICEGEVDCITICGMGGVLISTILEAGHAVLPVQRLVLQPNNGERPLRQWLFKHGWSITEEVILKENGKIYEIIAAEPGVSELEEADLLFGPKLRQRSEDLVFQEKWQQEYNKVERLLTSLNKATTLSEDIVQKKAYYQQKLSMIQEVIT
ncbi:tRNA (adenine(22)-N(1))-methyltransferase TrmK [Bacillaceae bacterium SIJ1]|uniref:tRNA (adenine(22)-N(1))-methyltransferase n=1 Tax=Litoribacterium kuwaitense TaxID=1398745 RepID=UPI0013EAA94C|nr:class I SAM-dependent methyltransferase [Litoribacterium kuwaitense]NGP43535.1 tRNA (adenine(22)-N(1))-methyltransferase TrmK [Litoribacterium kuwaitense]